MDEVREKALHAALQLKPHWSTNDLTGRAHREPSVTSVLADAKQIEEYLRGASKPDGKPKKK